MITDNNPPGYKDISLLKYQKWIATHIDVETWLDLAANGNITLPWVRRLQKKNTAPFKAALIITKAFNIYLKNKQQ